MGYASRIRASIQFFDDDEYDYVEADESLDTFREFMDSLDEPMRPLTREKEDLDAELQMLLKTVPDVPPFHDSDRIGIITPRLRSGKTGGNSLRRRNSGTVSPALSLETIELETPELPPNLPRRTLRETKNDNFFRHKSRSPFPPSQSQRVAVEDAQSEASGLLSSCPQTPRLADTSAKPVNTLSSKKVTPSPGWSRHSEEQKAMEDWNFKELATAEAWIKKKKRLTRKKTKKTTAAQRFGVFKRKARRYR